MDKTKIHKMWIADQGDGTYTNPILYTDYSDPDAIRVGEDYFMIASSFCNTPAVPLLHSKDLVNWKVINYIIDKLPFDYYDKPVNSIGAIVSAFTGSRPRILSASGASRLMCVRSWAGSIPVLSGMRTAKHTW